MEKRDGAFVFRKKDLEIGLDDGTFRNLELIETL